MTEYLAFVDEIGQTSDGGYIYRFDFSLDKEIVWGNYWNIAPANLVPDLKPDKKCLSKTFKAIIPCKMELACKNPCFSMQDCIDGIIPLCFPDIDNDYLVYNNKPFMFAFGEEYDEVIAKLQSIYSTPFDEEVIDSADKNAIENFVEGSNSDNNGLVDYYGDEFDDDNNDIDDDF